MTDPVAPPEQIARFAHAVELLGGKKLAAVKLDCSERQVHYLIDGLRPITPRWLERMAAALIAHADACRAYERQISPAFSENLTRDQIHAAQRERVKNG